MEAGYDARQAGRHAETEDMFLAAAQQADSFSLDDPRRATTFDNLADVYRRQGRNAEAEEYYRRALEIRVAALGPEHPRVAMSLTGLAALYRDQDQDGDAEPLYQRALSILEKALGTKDIRVAETLEGYAAVLRKIGRTAQAAEMETRARVIRSDE